MTLRANVLNVAEETEFFSYAQGLKKFISERTVASFVNIAILERNEKP